MATNEYNAYVERAQAAAELLERSRVELSEKLPQRSQQEEEESLANWMGDQDKWRKGDRVF
jgi:hypothetical protein